MLGGDEIEFEVVGRAVANGVFHRGGDDGAALGGIEIDRGLDARVVILGRRVVEAVGFTRPKEAVGAQVDFPAADVGGAGHSQRAAVGCAGDDLAAVVDPAPFAGFRLHPILGVVAIGFAGAEPG